MARAKPVRPRVRRSGALARISPLVFALEWNGGAIRALFDRSAKTRQAKQKARLSASTCWIAFSLGSSLGLRLGDDLWQSLISKRDLPHHRFDLRIGGYATMPRLHGPPGAIYGGCFKRNGAGTLLRDTCPHHQGKGGCCVGFG